MNDSQSITGGVPQTGSAPPPAGLFAEQLLAEQPATDSSVRASEAAARLGIETEEVEQLPFDLSVLEQEGIFVNVDASGFGLLDRRLDWSALGIRLPEQSAVSFRPPRIGVLPDRYRLPLQRPAAQAHTALGKYGYRFRLTETIFHTPEYRWIPWQAFAQFEADFIAAREALALAKSTALDHYDEIIEQVTATFTRLADDSARRISATTEEAFRDEATRAVFCARIVEGALNLVPSRADLQSGLTLSFKPGIIRLGSEMMREQRRAAEEKRLLATVEAETSAIEEDSRRRHRVEQMDMLAEEETRRQQMRHQEEELEREQAVKERIRNLKVEAARQQINESMSPLTEGMEQLHHKLFEMAGQMRDTLKNKSFVPGATAKSAREISRWFKLMNFQNDEGLDRLVTELNKLASAKTEARSPGDISEVLSDIIRATQGNARQFMQRNRFDALEI